MKTIDAIISDTLVGLIDTLNESGVKKDDIVTVLQNNQGQYVAVFYS